MCFLSLGMLLELVVVSLPAHVGPVAAFPGSHAPPLSRACPKDVPHQFPGTHTALPWKCSASLPSTHGEELCAVPGPSAHL